jgi:hypothetical protein
MKYAFTLIVLLSVTLCARGQEEGTLYLDSLTVQEFVDIAKAGKPKTKDRHFLTVFGSFGSNRICRADVVSLLPYIRNMDKTGCVLTFLSSYLPRENEYSTLGGIAMDIIDAYRNGEAYPSRHWSCTKTDRKRADEIDEWWARTNGTLEPRRR